MSTAALVMRLRALDRRWRSWILPRRRGWPRFDQDGDDADGRAWMHMAIDSAVMKADAERSRGSREEVMSAQSRPSSTMRLRALSSGERALRRLDRPRRRRGRGEAGPQVIRLVAERCELDVLWRLRPASRSVFAETSLREFWLVRTLLADERLRAACGCGRG
jgi:hypothetical protein